MCEKFEEPAASMIEPPPPQHRHMDSSLCVNTNQPGMSTYKRSDFEGIAAEYAHWAATRMNTSLHMAFVYGRRGVLLGMATNKIGTRSSGAGYSKTTLHAERAALKAVGDVSLLRGATLVVIRVHKNGTIMGSKPCHGCEMHLQKCMEKYGLKAVYYS